MMKRAICFGEVLWDVFPDRHVAGGAPMNVAIRLQSLGMKAAMISRIGMDAPGLELMRFLQNCGVDTTMVQSDDLLPTGEVRVTLDVAGIPSFEIVEPSAWDRIGLTDAARKAVRQADYFIFGSLACRNETSRKTLNGLLKLARCRVFDVNIRPPFYHSSLFRELAPKANLIKLNDEELAVVLEEYGEHSSDLESDMRCLAFRTGAGTVCVTLGAEGAALLTSEGYFRHPGYRVAVADTVGAGDSFLAALITRLEGSDDPAGALDFACAMGALVASKYGATPGVLPGEIEKVRGYLTE